jgi:hypothetical protein
MDIKTITRALLLLFVACSLVVLVVKHMTGGPSDADPAATEGGPPVRQDRPGRPTPECPAPQFVVYYFHGRERCDNCRTLEACAKEAVQTALGDDLKSGRIQWQVVDFSQRENRHFDQELKLGGVSSVVVVEMRDGKPGRFRLLEDGLMLTVTANRGEVVGYVQRELRAFIAGKTGG